MNTALKAPSIHVQIASRTDRGRVRSHNEDSLLITRLGGRDAPRAGAHLTAFTGDEVVRPGEGVVLAVCDGMGGAAGGEVASRQAVETIHAAIVRDGPASGRGQLARRLVSSVEEASREVLAVASRRPGLSGMGTTATVCALAGDRMLVAQVGDSRAYLLRNGRLTQITRDQTLAMLLVEKGQLTLEEMDDYEHANIILQAVGTQNQLEVDLRSVEVYRGDMVLVCSDGLTGLVNAATICEILTGAPNPAAACESLIALANEAGGRDNISCIVARLSGDGLPAPPDEPPSPAPQRVCFDTDPPAEAEITMPPPEDEATEDEATETTETNEPGETAEPEAEEPAAAPSSTTLQRIRSFLGF